METNESSEENEVQGGYFENRIKDHLLEHHPNMSQEGGIQSQLPELTQDAINLFQAYDRAGMPVYEAIERALTETLESITSPYSTLKDFLLENHSFLAYATGIEDLDEENLVMKILAENSALVSAYQMATAPEESVEANKELLSGIRKTLLSLNKN